MRYAVTLATIYKGMIFVTVPDIPTVLFLAADRKEAFDRAREAIETHIVAAISAGEEIPWPDARDFDYVELSAQSAAKIELYRAMRAEGVSESALSERLGVNRAQINRLLDPRQSSGLDLIESALSALDRSVSIVVARRRAACGRAPRQIIPLSYAFSQGAIRAEISQRGVKQ